MQHTQAIDLYAGVGGWSLGLRLAGIDVIASYELSEDANQTNRLNNGHPAHSVDIRTMEIGALPMVPYLVGSPPCTQFSTSNRGGSGDFEDGLRDVIRFLEIVEKVRPIAWAMENVPRLESVLTTELKEGGKLERFIHLDIKYRTFDLEKFGLPQRRRRCIAGNFDLDLLESYANNAPNVSLGEVVHSLNSERIKDPNFLDSLDHSDLYDHDLESWLSEEEVRINRSAKVLHPIYNAMKFPDAMDRATRTITATCTRVSRESIVIECLDQPGQFRRLSVRERACAQGFPIGYQFFGKSHAQKLKMVGNAMPPVFAYYVGHALRGTPAEGVAHTTTLHSEVDCLQRPQPTTPHKQGAKFLKSRTFRFAIPSLRLGSGVRFELSNLGPQNSIQWRATLIYGTSKDIRQYQPGPQDASWILTKISHTQATALRTVLNDLDHYLSTVDIPNLQAVWSHSGPGLTRPFMLLDELDAFAVRAKLALFPTPQQDALDLKQILVAVVGDADHLRTAKLCDNAAIILGGLAISSRANSVLARKGGDFWRPSPKAARIAAS